MNYNTYAAEMKHSPKVQQFYKQTSKQVHADLSCCRSLVSSGEVPQPPMVFQFQYAALADVQLLSVPDECNLNIPKFLRELCTKDKTDIQKEKKRKLIESSENKSMNDFVRNQFNKMKSLFDTYKVASKGKRCNWCFMMAHLHQYFQSEKYIEDYKKARQVSVLSDIENGLCTEMCFKILTEISNRCATEMKEKLITSTLENTHVEMNQHLKNSIRYISRAIIHDIKKKYSKLLENSSFVNKSKYYQCIRTVSSLTIPEAVALEQSENVESVKDVISRQKNGQSLYHVPDRVFHFFEGIYKIVSKYQSTDLMKVCPDQVYGTTKDALLNDVDCIDMWLSLLHSVPMNIMDHDCENAESNTDTKSSEEWTIEKQEIETEFIYSVQMQLYEECVDKFSKIHLSDTVSVFRDDFVTKGQALRTYLAATESSNKTSVKDTEVQYPSTVCMEECPSFFKSIGDSSVECSKCGSWSHFKCVGLKGNKPAVQPNSDIPWYCQSCTLTNENYESSMGSEEVARSTSRGRSRGKGRGRGRGTERGRGRGRGRARGNVGNSDQNQQLNEQSSTSALISNVAIPSSISSRGRQRKPKTIIDM